MYFATPRPDPLRTASERLRALLSDPCPRRVELLQLLDLLEEHIPASDGQLADRVERLERVQGELIRCLHQALRLLEIRQPGALHRLTTPLDRLDEALEAL